MTDRFPILPGTLPPVGKPSGARPQQPGKTTDGPSFDQVLQDKLQSKPLAFSRHAEQRMQQRGISFSPTQMGRLEEAVSRASAKGSKDSLVMVDETALVVSVKNNTVVTVADRDQLKQNVFTNIDSAVFA